MVDSSKKETFGTMLKKIRLEDARIGLRAFADLIGWQASNLSNLERGRVKAPADHKKILEICDALGLAPQDPRRTQLIDLAAKDRDAVPGDVAEAIRQQPGMPVLVRTVTNRRLDDKKLKELAEYIRTFY